MLHTLLSKHARANKFDGGSRLCVLCGSSHKDHYHILCCEHHSWRVTWWQGFLRDLRDFFISSNTSPLLSNLLLDSIPQWFLSPTDVLIQPERYHPLLHRIIHQQNQIGWGQFFMGRFAISWSRTQSQYFEHFRSVNDIKKHGTAWQTSLIQFVWECWFTLWKERNQEVHGRAQRAYMQGRVATRDQEAVNRDLSPSSHVWRQSATASTSGHRQPHAPIIQRHKELDSDECEYFPRQLSTGKAPRAARDAFTSKSFRNSVAQGTRRIQMVAAAYPNEVPIRAGRMSPTWWHGHSGSTLNRFLVFLTRTTLTWHARLTDELTSTLRGVLTKMKLSSIFLNFLKIVSCDNLS